MVILLSLLTVVTTLLGGVFALRFKDKLHLILGFSAGALLGVAFFDLLPEAIELASEAYPVSTVSGVIALAFVLYMSIDRLVMLHSHGDHDESDLHHQGKLGAGTLAFHSFLDGMAIGLAFQVSSAVGAVVSTAVLVHKFSDGINTVGLVLKNKGSSETAMRWVAMNAVAPALGAVSTLFFSLPETALGIILATFCGFFLYIGASDLLPESYHGHPTKWTTATTLLGVGVIYIVVRIAGL